MRSLVRQICIVAALCVVIGAAPETFTREQLDALEAEKRAAEAQLNSLKSAGVNTEMDINRLDSELLSATMETRRREEQATSSERKLIDLRTRQTAARTQLLQDQSSLEGLLAALAAANRRRPPAIIVSPSKANTAVRRAILMSNTTPRLAARADALKVEIDELNDLERSIRGERARLDVAEATLALKQEEIERYAAIKRASHEDLSSDIDALRARSESLGAQASTLRELLTALEDNAPATPGVKPQRKVARAATPAPSAKPATRVKPPVKSSLKPLGASALGGLTRPAPGMISQAFGAKLTGGGRSEGIRIVTRHSTPVVAPADGRIEFAKTFRSYGPMLILRTSDEYHVILSGMSRIYVTEGQNVAAGEPVGRMTSRADPPPELYMELRHGDDVMNPANWMKRGK